MSQFVIGLTGGIGSGKSTAANYFRELGIDVIDSDDISRQVVLPAQPAFKKIVDHFSDAVLDPDGNLNRAALGKIVFSNPQERQWLENLLHPTINQHITQQLKQVTAPYAVLMSPLLLETVQKEMVRRVLVIDCPQDVQEKRVMQRNPLSLEYVRKVIAAQMTREQRLVLADDIIVNEKSLTKLSAGINTMHQSYIQLVDKL